MAKEFAGIKIFELKKIKSNVKLFVFDYDGTIYDGNKYKEVQVINLIEKIINNGKLVAIITARAATALKIIVPPVRKFLFKKNINSPVFISGGNGVILYKIKDNRLIQIYNYGLSIKEIKHAINCWDKIYKDFRINEKKLSLKGIKTFNAFIKENWVNYIPNKLIELSKLYNGKIFIEEAKVSFVLPKDKTTHDKLIKAAQEELGDNYALKPGDETFAHITKNLKEDGKLIAVKTILKGLGFKKNEVITFGDMPNGNDKGLLSFPYSFTNSKDYIKSDKPPFVLVNNKLNSVARVYKAVDSLIY